MRTYKDFCRAASPIERTAHMAKPGDVILGNATMPAMRVPGRNVVKIGKRRERVA
jgi:hypothetical protein